MPITESTRQRLGASSSITIEELALVSSGAQSRRTLVLAGPALPFKGAEWGSENNLTTTWYPGNAVEGTQHILGPRELPTTWEGSWKRTQLGAEPVRYIDEHGQENQIASPHLLRDILEDIARTGLRLRVTWESSQNMVTGSTTPAVPPNQVRDRIVREGRIKTIKFPHDRLTDIRWNLEFNWVSRGGTNVKTASLREDVDVSRIADGIVAAINAALAASIKKRFQLKSNILKSSSEFTLGQLEAITSFPSGTVKSVLTQMQKQVSKFKRIGSIAANLRTQPQQAVQASIDFATNTSAIAKQFVTDFGWQPSETMSTKDRVSSMLIGYVFVAGVVDESIRVARASDELERKAKALSVPVANEGAITVRDARTNKASSVIAIHVCKQGDTAQSVSKKFYGVPDHAVDILRANRLPWHTVILRRGTILYIPTLRNQVNRV